MIFFDYLTNSKQLNHEKNEDFALSINQLQYVVFGM